MQKYMALAGLLILGSAGAQEGPPVDKNGTISNPVLVENSSIAKAQSVGIITTFMGKGAQECDDEGKNCRSLFGQDDSLDYNSIQLNGQASSGVQAFSFLSGSSTADKMDTNTVASQVGSLVLACGDYEPKTIAGIAVKLSSCYVTPTGDSKITYQVCTGPARGNPVQRPLNAVPCSADPAALNYRPPPGYVCERAACDSEPVGTLNGWSDTSTLSYSQATATGGSDDDKAKNGLGLSFYPALGSGVPANYSADSDNMVAVKVVQTALNASTKQSAVAFRVAFRHKTLVTKEMMIQGASSVPDPGKFTSAWDTVEKLNTNPLIPQFQQTYAANGSECLQQIQNGIATDGIVSVCDQDYSNESGIRPGALTAQIASDGQACGTTTQCLQEIVNTNTWEETCRADVPLAIRKCTTKQDYDLEKLSYVRTKSKEQCIEERSTMVKTCNTTASIGTATEMWAPATDLSFSGSTNAQTVLKFERWFAVPAGTIVIQARLGVLHVDNWGEIRLNGVRVWAQLDRNLWNAMDGNTYNNCDNDTWETQEWDYDNGSSYTVRRSGVRCTLQNGVRTPADYSDACINACAAPVRLDIPVPFDLVKIGQANRLEMSCFNNKGPSACNFSVELQYLNISKYNVVNECAAVEQAR